MPKNQGSSVSASLNTIAKMIEAGTKLGVQLLESLSTGAPEALSGMLGWASSECDSCHIPPPCWMPRTLCEVISDGKTGNTARITFVIASRSMATRVVSILTTTPLPGLTFSATNLTLGPMERGEIEVSYLIPATLKPGLGTEILLWIRGCRLHFLRWTIRRGLISADTDFEVFVTDGPENLHYWYDHFYCPHPCLPDQRERGQ